MSDIITTRLRQTRADMIGTDDEQHYWDCHDAAAEIERLRLTDAEREAVRFCVTASLPETEKLGGVAGGLCRMHAATLRGLLERLSPEAPISGAGKSAQAANTPPEPSPASAGYADARLVERALREVLESVNEASRAHAMNYAGLLHALLGKGVITAEELEAGREKARPAVDEHFGPTPDERKAKELVELLQRLKGKA